MAPHRTTLAIPCALLVIAACGRGDVDAAGESLGETWEELKASTYDERQALAGELDERLREAEARLEDLRREAGELGADARADLQDELDELESRREDLAARLDRVGDASAEAWTELRDGLVDSARALSEGLTEARADAQD